MIIKNHTENAEFCPFSSCYFSSNFALKVFVSNSFKVMTILATSIFVLISLFESERMEAWRAPYQIGILFREMTS